MKQIPILLIMLSALLFFQGTKKSTVPVFNLKALEKSLKLIPAGSIVSENEPGFLVAKVSSFKSFYMYKHEVTNGEYLVFLQELKTKDQNMYSVMLPDTTVWQSRMYYSEAYMNYYFRHPAYHNYPVVGITHKQAEAYCQWLTERYLKEEKRKFSKMEFRLPTSDEWEYAAKGGLGITPYPWGGPYLQNKKGQWLANFHVISQGDITRKDIIAKQEDGTTEAKNILVADSYHGPGYAEGFSPEGGDCISPALSYFPNDYGLYNMAGNVEEFVSEPGITHGGSFYDTGYYLQNHITEQHDSLASASFERGFRFVMIVSE